MTEAQRERVEQKLEVWAPAKGTMKKDISLLISELWEYLRPEVDAPAVINTDEQPLYRALLAKSPVCCHFHLAGLFTHRRIPGSAPRTLDNPLFPANYVDRLLRHRVRKPVLGTHAGRGAIASKLVPEVQRQFFTRRIRVLTRVIPDSVRQVWTAKVITPPVRWKVGQQGTSIRVPAYALADLDPWYKQAA